MLALVLEVASSMLELSVTLEWALSLNQYQSWLEPEVALVELVL